MKFEGLFALQHWFMRSALVRWAARVLGHTVPADRGFGKFNDKQDGHHDSTP